MADTLDWLSERIHDKKHFTSRFAAHVADVSGTHPSTVAYTFCGLSFLILTFTSQAHLFANTLLVGVPLLLIFVYPEEKPTDESFFFYFSVFGGVTLFDRSLECIPCYYVLKVVAFLMFYVPAFNQTLNGLFPVEAEVSQRSKVGSRKSLPNNSSKSSTRTAVLGLLSPVSEKTQRRVDLLPSPSPRPSPALPKSSDVKVTIIEEYYREEELLSPNGTVIERIVSGPFRKESTRTESNRSVKSPT